MRKQISELPTLTAPVGTDIIPVVQGGVTQSITRQQLHTLQSYSAGTLPPPGIPGRLAFHTDSGLLIVDDGTQWTLAVPLLFHADYTTGTLSPITGQSAAFSRNSVAREWDGSSFNEVAVDVGRLAVDENGVVGLLLEASQENLLLQSANIDDSASPWTGNSAWTITEKVSVISGSNAYQHVNDGLGSSRNRQQTVGTLSGTETLVFIVENVDATATQIAIRDQTDNDWTARILLNWSTGLTSVVSSGVGTVVNHGSIDLNTTLNGGTETRLVWVTVTADTPGNARGVWTYLTDTPTSTDTVIVHYAGLVESGFLTSPIVTAGSAVTRAAEELAYTYTVSATQPWSALVRFVVPPAGSPALLRIGNAAPDLLLEVTSGGEIRVTHDNNVSTVSSTTSGLSMSQGDVVEARVRFGSDGKVTVGASVNGGAETVGSQSAALAPATWGSAELYPGGLSAEMARVHLREIKIHPNPDLTLAQLRSAA